MVSGLLLLAVGGLFAWLGQLQPAGRASQAVVMEINEGASFAEVARRLRARGMVKSERAFVWMGRLAGLDRKIIPGEYAFHAGMAPLKILRKLSSGESRPSVVTIPEGFSAKQIAGVLHEKHLADRAEYLRLTGDTAFIRTLSMPVDNLEGYLFPDTYLFTRRMSPEAMIRTMVSRFRQIVTAADRARAETLGFSLHQAVTLASLIEKEAARAGERALISGVFHNRLRRNMPLQSDPTVIYALRDFDGDLRKKDLLIKSPYNTYRATGLPPGPIANPGAAAIHAALYPASTGYMYFVSRNDGSHQFSVTLAEHRRAVKEYQMNHRRRAS